MELDMNIGNIYEMRYFSKPKEEISLSQNILSNLENVIACCMTDQW
jgi:hypothetical protein